MSDWKAKLKAVIAAHPKGKPLTVSGGEILDPTPVAPPVGYKAEPSMFEVIRKMIADERLKAALEAEGLETPEEADDFDVDDEYEPHSPYEHNFDHVADPGELQRLRDAIDLRERELSNVDRRPASADRGGASAGEPASASGPGKPAAPDGK